MIRSLRRTLKKRFKIIEVIGKGSYGCVSKAKCLQTGRIVALKVMKNQTQLEYEIIKLLREIQIMRQLNEIQERVKHMAKDCNITSFVPELIDIITPEPHGSSNRKHARTFDNRNGKEPHDLS